MPITKNSSSFRPGQEISLKINDLAFGGKGVGRVDGIACFVPGVIDGEEVRVRIRRVKSRLLEADLLEVLQPSPHRVEAPCPVFLKCGGCGYQHIDYAHQLAIKGNQLRQALKRLGGLAEPPVSEVIPSPEQFAYRNRITVHVKEGEAGFFAEGSHRVVSVDRCLIASDDVNAGLKDLTESRPLDGDYLIGEKKRFGGFRQVNNSVAEILSATVTEAVRSGFGSAETGELLVDAYCGAGYFAHQLQAFFNRVIGIERSLGSVAMARRQAAGNEHYLEGAVEEKLHQALAEGSPAGTTLILDPPSEGLAESVTEAIMDRPPARIVYVSCDPATLARDAKRLSGHYQLQRVTPLDMFPQTAEIESVSVFELPA
jgi:23S rRNA (uracil1939-C5)-methyltransferase